MKPENSIFIEHLNVFIEGPKTEDISLETFQYNFFISHPILTEINASANIDDFEEEHKSPAMESINLMLILVAWILSR